MEAIFEILWIMHLTKSEEWIGENIAVRTSTRDKTFVQTKFVMLITLFKVTDNRKHFVLYWIF